MGDARPIGVLDSGVGGISVLRELVRRLPEERFIFYGDTANAPYGDKTREEVVGLTRRVVEGLLDEGAKAVVIACNTATSAAAETLRTEHVDIPIVGVEPALKPAVLAHPKGRVLVMATALTLRLDKYRRLLCQWGSEAEVHEVACVGLVERIEQEDLGSPDLIHLLKRMIGSYAGKVDAVVLGCTHYPFVRRQVQEVIGGVECFDGAAGTARRLRSLLAERDMLAPAGSISDVVFRSSTPGPQELERYRRFLSIAP